MEINQIILVTNASPALQYGIGTYINQLIKGVGKDSDYIVSVIELDCNINGFLYSDDNGYRLFQIPSWREYAEKENRKAFYEEASRWLSLHFENREQIILHFNSLLDEDFVNSLKETFTTAKSITTIHYFDWAVALLGNRWHFQQIISAQKFGSKLEKVLYNIYLRESEFYSCLDGIICLTEASKRILHEDYGLSLDKIAIVPNGIEDVGSLSSLNTKSDILFQEASPILLYVGRLDKSKGVDELIKAFHDVLKIHPKAQLILAGDGNFLLCLKECSNIWEHVTFTGKVDSDTLHRLYQLANIGIIPSYSEQCSYVAIEMMMHGLPIIGTDCDGLKEMLPPAYCIPIHTEEENIYIDSKELADTILQHFPNVGEEHSFRTLYEERYQLSIMSEKIKSIYRSLW